ncbi:tyrosine-type recombinase/integrase [Arthrobacter sp. NPDC056886]|uniref:tyrosine-type recombinase/integrase n=1 Tax=Arthrobacter sp. NPDC056886 TaxID=3345960 RepID=UPI00367094D0
MARIAKVDTPEGWAVLDARGVPIAEATAFLRHLESIESSRHTIKAYGTDLAHFFTFMETSGVMWTAVTNEVMGQFIKYLRTPNPKLIRPSNPHGVLSARSVNRSLAAISAFALYLFDSVGDPVYPHLLKSARRTKKRHSEADTTQVTVGPRLSNEQKDLKLLTPEEAQRIIGACSSLRDKFLFSLLNETGMRIGQALLLRHSDVRVPDSYIRILRYDPPPNASVEERNKSWRYAAVPVPPGLIRLYAAYMHTEYRNIESDSVFINLWSGKIGHPLTYKTVEKLVKRVQDKTGLKSWSPHAFRHSYVTRLLNAGVAMETVSYLITHSSIVTTIDTYSHLNVNDVRSQLDAAGVWK